MGEDGRESSPLANSKSGDSGVMRGGRPDVDIFFFFFFFLVLVLFCLERGRRWSPRSKVGAQRGFGAGVGKVRGWGARCEIEGPRFGPRSIASGADCAADTWSFQSDCVTVSFFLPH